MDRRLRPPFGLESLDLDAASDSDTFLAEVGEGGCGVHAFRIADMSGKTILNAVFFVIFFTVGIAAVALSILALEIGTMYRDEVILQRLEASNKRLQALDQQYAYQLEEIKRNPAVLARLRVLNLGEEPQDPETAYPPARSSELIQAARNILTQKEVKDKDEPPLIPFWLLRACRPRSRVALFLAGTALIVISMTFFGRPAEPPATPRPQP